MLSNPVFTILKRSLDVEFGTEFKNLHLKRCCRELQIAQNFDYNLIKSSKTQKPNKLLESNI